MRFDHAARTIAGRRANNEDALCAEPELGLFAVADGMGGYEGGEVASHLVVGTLAEFFRKNVMDAEATWPQGIDPKRDLLENLVAVGVDLANREVRSRRKGVLEHMGSTVAAIAVRGEEVVIGHVGDSRVYRLRDGRLRQLTRDHSLYAEMEASGAPLPATKAEFPWSNVITRAIGMEQAEVELMRDRVRAGDVYLLCTDGLVERLAEARIEEVLRSMAPAAACATLVEEAYARGGKDNITAVIVRALDGREERAA